MRRRSGEESEIIFVINESQKPASLHLGEKRREKGGGKWEKVERETWNGAESETENAEATQGLKEQVNMGGEGGKCLSVRPQKSVWIHTKLALVSMPAFCQALDGLNV